MIDRNVQLPLGFELDDVEDDARERGISPAEAQLISRSAQVRLRMAHRACQPGRATTWTCARTDGPGVWPCSSPGAPARVTVAIRQRRLTWPRACWG